MVLPGHRASIMSFHDDSCSPEEVPSFYDVEPNWAGVETVCRPRLLLAPGANNLH